MGSEPGAEVGGTVVGGIAEALAEHVFHGIFDALAFDIGLPLSADHLVEVIVQVLGAEGGPFVAVEPHAAAARARSARATRLSDRGQPLVQ